MGKSFGNFVGVISGLSLFGLAGCSSGYWLERSSSLAASLAEGVIAASGAIGAYGDLGGGAGTSVAAVRLTRPAFAVRGMACTVCHGQFDSNVVTDFGLDPTFSNFSHGSTRTFNRDTVYGNRDASSWQSVQVNGFLYVPKLTLPTAAVSLMFGVSESASLKTVLTNARFSGNSAAIAAGISAPSGQDSVIERKTVTISYPTDAEIVALVPDGADPAKYVGPVRGAAAGSAISGIVTDAKGIARNPAGVVTCTGDVVVSSVLFLKNLQLTTDAGGCRLYARSSVFLQGPIRYLNGGGGQHLQISSARAIIMGISAMRLGATSPTDATRVSAGENSMFNGTPGGPYLRFSRSIDSRYAPGADAPARVAMLDQIVADAVAVGAELLDAGDSSQFGSLPAGASVDSSGRMAVPYSGLLLNAPHVHSRYGGLFKGVVIAEIAVFPLSETRFAYDPIFDTVPAILPALARPVFQLSAD